METGIDPKVRVKFVSMRDITTSIHLSPMLN